MHLGWNARGQESQHTSFPPLLHSCGMLLCFDSLNYRPRSGHCLSRLGPSEEVHDWLRINIVLPQVSHTAFWFSVSMNTIFCRQVIQRTGLYLRP